MSEGDDIYLKALRESLAENPALGEELLARGTFKQVDGQFVIGVPQMEAQRVSVLTWTTPLKDDESPETLAAEEVIVGQHDDAHWYVEALGLIDEPHATQEQAESHAKYARSRLANIIRVAFEATVTVTSAAGQAEARQAAASSDAALRRACAELSEAIGEQSERAEAAEAQVATVSKALENRMAEMQHLRCLLAGVQPAAAGKKAVDAPR